MKIYLTIVIGLLSIISYGQDGFLVHPYLQLATQTSIHVLCETKTESDVKVLYTEAKLRAKKVEFDQTQPSVANGMIHDMHITGLKPATKYMYKVVATDKRGITTESKILTFKTNVLDDGAYTFALVGDSQHSSSAEGIWGDIAKKVWGERPNFIIHVGDLVDVGTRKTDWTDYFFPLGNIALSRFPMYSVLGNHEQDAQYYYDYMVNPAPEYYYTFTYGNAQFFMVDTNRDVQEGSDQYDWLEWELAKSKAKWKFVVHHHPPYSSEENDHGDSYKGMSSYGTHARNLVPLYDAYGVDFCLFGHTHVYERSWPLLENKINLKNGVTYINTGGAGGGLEDFDPVRSWFSKEIQTGHHYCTFSIFDGQAVFKSIGLDGSVFDMFEMNKKEDTNTGMVIPPAPHFRIDKQVFQDKALVEMIPLSDEFEIYYTLDGSEPSQSSSRYTAPFNVSKSSELKARCYTKDGKVGRVVSRKFIRMDPQPAISETIATQRGLKYKYYEGDWQYLPDFNELTPLKSGVVSSLNIDGVEHRENHFGVVMEGYVEVPETDTYTFYTYSDDGSKLYINDQLLVDSDGRHSAKYIHGTTILQKGKHKLRVEYFEGRGNNFIYAGFVHEGKDRVPFSPFELSHKK